VAWGFNDEEKAAIVKRQQEREQEALEREFAILNRSAEREAESTVIRLQADLGIEKAKVATEDDLRRLILANELSFVDARESGIRAEQMKALEGELQLNRRQRLDGLQAQLETEQHAVQMARAAGDKRDVEHDVAVREQRHLLEVERIKAEILDVRRTMEDSDRRQKVALERIEWQFAQEIQIGRVKTMRELGEVERDEERAKVDLNIRKGDAEGRWRNEAAQQASAAEAEMARILSQSTPEQILAINTRSSANAAHVLVEQARAKAVVGAAAASVRPAAVVTVADGATVECPECHSQIAATFTFCPNCRRQMRQ
jgi:hypothetical protein